jgi:AAA15 family ATPase/GTPase
MFLNFKIANYRSIGKEITIDFGIRDSQKLGAFSEINEQAINNVACLVGPNASGKSNILKGIVLFLKYLLKSYSLPALRETAKFTGHFCRKGFPVEFSTEFISNLKQYKYEVSILDGIVQKEILRKRDKTSKRYSYIFKRIAGNDISFNKIKINPQDLSRLGDDMSLMSLMLELNYFEKNEFNVFNMFVTNVKPGRKINVSNPYLQLNFISQELQKDNILLDELIDELKTIDTGISSLKLGKSKMKIQRSNTGEISKMKLSTMLAGHKVANKEYPLLLLEESNGTLRYIETFICLSKVLQNGGMFIVDELEQSFHPDLTGRIINMFLNKDKNPNNSQLLFTTHNPWFLQDFTKTQIFITEKNNKAVTEITRLDEIAGVRNDENYFLKYIAGEYDGCPKIKEA